MNGGSEEYWDEGNEEYSALICTLKVNYALNKLNQLCTYLFVLKNIKNMKTLNSNNKSSFKRTPNLFGYCFLKLLLRTIFENVENAIVFLIFRVFLVLIYFLRTKINFQKL